MEQLCLNLVLREGVFQGEIREGNGWEERKKEGRREEERKEGKGKRRQKSIEIQSQCARNKGHGISL